jgi:hypothetical protein
MVEHVWFRRYERAWVDRLYAGIGRRWQKSFSSRDAWYARYEQDHRFSDTCSLLVGTVYSQNVYDAEDVNVFNVYTTFIKRF